MQLVVLNQCRAAVRMVAQMLPNKNNSKEMVLTQAWRLINFPGEDGEAARRLVKKFVASCPQCWGASRSSAYWRIMDLVGIDSQEALAIYLVNFPDQITRRQRQAVFNELTKQRYHHQKIEKAMKARFIIRDNRGYRSGCYSSTW